MLNRLSIAILSLATLSAAALVFMRPTLCPAQVQFEVISPSDQQAQTLPIGSQPDENSYAFLPAGSAAYSPSGQSMAKD